LSNYFSHIYAASTLILLAGFILFLSACSTPNNETIIALEQTNEVCQPDLLDPDLGPVSAEPEISLDQELKALARSGPWERPQSHAIDNPVLPEQVEEEPLYDFPVVTNRQVAAYVNIFTGKQRKYFNKWLIRSGRYGELIQHELEAAGLPKDLMYLAMIESGYDQRAYSKSRAVGLWQFMAPTGRDYGLSISRYVDERRSAEKSTKAAVAYLKDLYTEFGDWYLAVAAYNGGPGTMRKAMRKSKSKDFWQLAQGRHLRLETKRYVPKLLAAIIIAKEPEKYGFNDISYEEPLRWETLEVGPGLSMDAVALLTESTPKQIKMLNQELRVSKTPLDRQRYLVKIPPGTKALAQTNLPRLHSIVNTDYKTHIVGSNETLANICGRYNINTTTLLKVNNLTSSILKKGTRLRIPQRVVTYRLLPEGMDARLAFGDNLILHKVKRGETLSKISRRYQVPAELIVAWNGLPSIHKIAEGQQLALYLGASGPGKESSSASSSSSADQSPVIVLSDSSKWEEKAAQPENLFTWYQVRTGDSLWTISKKFNTSPDRIKRWNNLKSNLIHPGNRLKLKDV
jgi:membrane-bound lytic murein transglycosylase D